MGLILVAAILALFPVFVVLIGRDPKRRDLALIAIGLLIFLVGDMRINGWLLSWPGWAGTLRGMSLAPHDMIALALIVTRRRGFKYLPFRVLIALYAMPILLSLTMASIPMATVFAVFQVAQMFVLFAAVAGELDRPSALPSILIGFSFGLMIQAGFVVQQKLAGVVQATGTGIHQNSLGMMVELTILPLIAAVLEGQRSKLIYLGIVAGMVVTAGGGSRATMAIIGVSVVLLTLVSLVRRSTPRKLQVMGLGVLAAVVVVPLGYATLKDRFGETSVLTEEEQRAAFERAASAMARDYPLGVGANLYVNVANMQGYASRGGVAWNSGNRAAPVHNGFLLARAETGWAGEVMFIALLIVPMIVGVFVAFRDRRSLAPGVALGAAVSLLAVTVHSNYEFALHTTAVQTPLFLALALIAGAVRAYRLEQAARRRAARQAKSAEREQLTNAPALSRVL